MFFFKIASSTKEKNEKKVDVGLGDSFSDELLMDPPTAPGVPGSVRVAPRAKEVEVVVRHLMSDDAKTLSSPFCVKHNGDVTQAVAAHGSIPFDSPAKPSPFCGVGRPLESNVGLGRKVDVGLGDSFSDELLMDPPTAPGVPGSVRVAPRAKEVEVVVRHLMSDDAKTLSSPFCVKHNGDVTQAVAAHGSTPFDSPAKPSPFCGVGRPLESPFSKKDVGIGRKSLESSCSQQEGTVSLESPCFSQQDEGTVSENLSSDLSGFKFSFNSNSNFNQKPKSQITILKQKIKFLSIQKKINKDHTLGSKATNFYTEPKTFSLEKITLQKLQNILTSVDFSFNPKFIFSKTADELLNFHQKVISCNTKDELLKLFETQISGGFITYDLLKKIHKNGYRFLFENENILPIIFEKMCVNLDILKISCLDKRIPEKLFKGLSLYMKKKIDKTVCKEKKLSLFAEHLLKKKIQLSDFSNSQGINIMIGDCNLKSFLENPIQKLETKINLVKIQTKKLRKKLNPKSPEINLLKISAKELQKRLNIQNRTARQICHKKRNKSTLTKVFKKLFNTKKSFPRSILQTWKNKGIILKVDDCDFIDHLTPKSLEINLLKISAKNYKNN